MWRVSRRKSAFRFMPRAGRLPARRFPHALGALALVAAFLAAGLAAVFLAAGFLAAASASLLGLRTRGVGTEK